MLLGVVAVLVTVLVLSIVYRSKVGVAVSCLGVVVSGLPLLYILHWTLISPFNMWGLLKREPAASELVAEYRLDPGWSSSYISAMGYKNLSGSITLSGDSTFAAKDIPACCVHGEDENRRPFSGGYYFLSGTWKISKSSAVYVIDLSISAIAGEGVPSDAELNRFFISRVPRKNLQLRIMKGKPLSVGFAVFNGDFDYIQFSRRQPESSAASSATTRRD